LLNYDNYITSVKKPELVNTVFKRSIGDLIGIFGQNEQVYEGNVISETFVASVSTSAGAYVDGDPDPVSFTQVLVNPYWTKVQYHESVEVSKSKLSNAGSDAKRRRMIDFAMAQGGANLYDKVFSGCMSQLASDIDETGSYSTGALSRTTYTTLASDETPQNGAITLAAMQAARKACFLNKNVGPRSGYVWLIEEAAYNTFEPLAAATRTYNVNDGSTQQGVDTGYPPVSRFEGSDCFTPGGMTTGNMFFVRKQDVLICPHRTLETERVPSGMDTIKYVLRVGINLHVINPGFQAKITGAT